DLVAGRVADQKVPRPRGPDLAVFLGGKAAFLSLVFAVPMLLHPAWVVLLFYGATSMGVGVLWPSCSSWRTASSTPTSRCRGGARGVWRRRGRRARSRPP